MQTIENLVACHEVAQSRYKAGRPSWDLTISIKDLFEEDADNNDLVVQVAHAVAARLRAALPAEAFDDHSEAFDHEIDDIASHFAQMRVEDEPEGLLVDYFNDWLTQLYDWADLKRVWLK